MGLSATMQREPEATRQLRMTAFGVCAKVGVLIPYSRLQESEEAQSSISLQWPGMTRGKR